jgi:hypothetical protein
MTTIAFVTGIIRGTPLWVWGLLALVLYLGYTSTRDRTIDARRALILPLAMFGMSLSFMLSGPVAAEVLAIWGVALALGAAGGAALGFVSGATPGDKPMTIDLRGEYLSLALIIAMFSSRYVFAVMIAMTPALAGDMSFLIIRAAVVGLLGGLFLGRGLTITWVGLRPRGQENEARA